MSIGQASTTLKFSVETKYWLGQGTGLEAGRADADGAIKRYMLNVLL
jgi:hypothetical protein